MWFLALPHYSPLSVRSEILWKWCFFHPLLESLGDVNSLFFFFVEVLGWACRLSLENPGFALNLAGQSCCWKSLEEGHKIFTGCFSHEGCRPILLSSKDSCTLPMCISVFCSRGWMYTWNISAPVAHTSTLVRLELSGHKQHYFFFSFSASKKQSALFRWNIHAIISTEWCLLDSAVLPHGTGKPI